MSKRSSQKKKQAEQAAVTRKKQLIVIGIAAGVIVVILIAIIAFLNRPQASSVSRLEFNDIVVGTGREARTGDTVMVEFIGWVYGRDRKDFFDRSANHEGPFQFILGKGQAIEGFDQGIVGMKEGGQRELIVPPELGYGKNGALNGKIPPNTALRFEVELVEVATTLPPTSVKELKVEDLVVGTGATAQSGKTITVHYNGWLENGSKFDTSYDNGEPIEFVLGKGQVIAGWEQGLTGMRVGGKRRLTIPPDLGYGSKGAFKSVPPNAALIFEVELLAVK
jgi:peptidylprolyl isomerase